MLGILMCMGIALYKHKRCERLDHCRNAGENTKFFALIPETPLGFKKILKKDTKKKIALKLEIKSQIF